MPEVPNPYCAALRIPVPRLSDLVHRPRAQLLDAIVVALLVRGGPLALDELVGALREVRPENPLQLGVAIHKAVVHRDPVVKDAQGRFALDLGSERLPVVLWRAGVDGKAANPPLRRPAGPTPDTPLSLEEVRAAVRLSVPFSISGTSFAAAVLDAHDGPMSPRQIVDAVRGDTDQWVPEPSPTLSGELPGLVLLDEAGRLALNRASPDLRSLRSKIRVFARRKRRPALDAQARAVIEHLQAVSAGTAQPPLDPSTKHPWQGRVLSVQPRIRLTRSYDQRQHGYLGYLLRLRGEVGGASRDFLVGVGAAAHAKHQFRAGDEVRGVGYPIENPDLEVSDLYRVSALELGARGPADPSPAPPFTGVAPALEVYRARGHRRLAAATFAATCSGCLWACEMAVEMIIDQWNPSKRRYRRESFCYGPKNCALYVSGPTRKVPGRKGMSWTEADWVDEDATSHRGDAD